MNRLPKNLLFTILTGLPLPDIHNYFLVNPKTHENYQSSNFWKRKQLNDFPKIQFPINSKFDEIEKYRRLMNSGTLYLWSDSPEGGNDIHEEPPFNLDIYPKKILFNGLPMPVLKALPYSQEFVDGVYILTCFGELYILGGDVVSFDMSSDKVITRNNIYQEPKMILENVYDIYVGRVGELFLQTKIGNILQYKEGTFLDIWTSGHVTKFMHGLVLTSDHKLHLTSQMIVKHENIRDFTVTSNFIYYLTLNSNLIVEEYLSPVIRLDDRQAKPYRTEVISTHVKNFTAEGSSYCYINKDNNLFFCELWKSTKFVSSDVSQVTMDFATTYYIKTDLTLFKYLKHDRSARPVSNIKDVLNVWSDFDIQAAIAR